MISGIQYSLENAKEEFSKLPEAGDTIMWNDEEYIVLGAKIFERLDGEIRITLKVSYDWGLEISSKLRDKDEIREEASEILEENEQENLFI